MPRTGRCARSCALFPRDVGTYTVGTSMPAFSPADQGADTLVSGTIPSWLEGE
jgi:hypothetical protein